MNLLEKLASSWAIAIEEDSFKAHAVAMVILLLSPPLAAQRYTAH